MVPRHLEDYQQQHRPDVTQHVRHTFAGVPRRCGSIGTSDLGAIARCGCSARQGHRRAPRSYVGRPIGGTLGLRSIPVANLQGPSNCIRDCTGKGLGNNIRRPGWAEPLDGDMRTALLAVGRTPGRRAGLGMDPRTSRCLGLGRCGGERSCPPALPGSLHVFWLSKCIVDLLAHGRRSLPPSFRVAPTRVGTVVTDKPGSGHTVARGECENR